MKAARTARQRAASRANLIKARAARKRRSISPKTRRRVRRTTKAVGVVGLVAGGAYGAHKLAGNQLIISSRTPTVTHHISGRKIGSPGVKRYGRTISVMHRNSKGDKHILYGVSPNGVFGSKTRGHPAQPGPYKPRRAVVHPFAFKSANYPHTQEALVASRRRSTNRHRAKIGINEAEAMRRTNSYIQARSVHGRKVSNAERMKVLRKYRTQTARGTR